jgi:hypothetical protein
MVPDLARSRTYKTRALFSEHPRFIFPQIVPARATGNSIAAANCPATVCP